MNGDVTYIEWKQWDKEKFASMRLGSLFYFGQMFRSIVRHQSNILEIGFGNGELLGYFAAQGHSVIGVEINDHLIERANESGFVAYKGCVSEIPELQHHKFDLIVALDVAEHMNFVELNTLFYWARNHLCDSGRLYLRFPEGASPFGLANQNGDFTHVTALTRPKIEALCSGNDLNLVSYSDDILSSNKLCSIGFIGKLLLLLLQWCARVLKKILSIVFFPISTSMSFATNSIAIISISNNDKIT